MKKKCIGTINRIENAREIQLSRSLSFIYYCFVYIHVLFDCDIDCYIDHVEVLVKNTCTTRVFPVVQQYIY